jgi:3-hydroxyisobutyrate dehydrogenase-like beta-hydroxyacid dehydrogenase
MRLFREAAKETSTRTPLADIFQQQLRAATDAGLGDADWAAGYYRQTQKEAQGVEAR